MKFVSIRLGNHQSIAERYVPSLAICCGLFQIHLLNHFAYGRGSNAKHILLGCSAKNLMSWARDDDTLILFKCVRIVVADLKITRVCVHDDATVSLSQQNRTLLELEEN